MSGLLIAALMIRLDLAWWVVVGKGLLLLGLVMVLEFSLMSGLLQVVRVNLVPVCPRSAVCNVFKRIPLLNDSLFRNLKDGLATTDSHTNTPRTVPPACRNSPFSKCPDRVQNNPFSGQAIAAVDIAPIALLRTIQRTQREKHKSITFTMISKQSTG